VRPEHAGKYTCTASDYHGSGLQHTSEFDIIVIGGESGTGNKAVGAVTWYSILIPALIVVGILLSIALRLVFRLKMVLSDGDFKAFLEGRQDTDAVENQTISCLPYNRKYEAEKRQISIGRCILHIP